MNYRGEKSSSFLVFSLAETQSGKGFNKMFEVKRFRFLTVSTRKLPEGFNMSGVCNAIRQSWKLFYGVLCLTFFRSALVYSQQPSVGLGAHCESSLLSLQLLKQIMPSPPQLLAARRGVTVASSRELCQLVCYWLATDLQDSVVFNEKWWLRLMYDVIWLDKLKFLAESKELSSTVLLPFT